MFLAHKLDIPINGYKPIAQLDNKFVITHRGLVSNVCPHQKSIISTKQGTGIRHCPYHSWSFNLDGTPLGSGRTIHYCKNDTALETKAVYEWNHLLFTSPVDFDVPADFSGMILREQRVDTVNACSDNIMDLFLDVDHIPGVHTGVYDKINLPNITDVNWKFYNNGSVQLVPSSSGIGAAWISVYPNTMIEWQPGALFITVAKEVSNFESRVHVFKYEDMNYPQKIYSLNEEVWEQAWDQDKTQAALITEFCYTNLEESKEHFRNWIIGNRINQG